MTYWCARCYMTTATLHQLIQMQLVGDDRMACPTCGHTAKAMPRARNTPTR